MAEAVPVGRDLLEQAAGNRVLEPVQHLFLALPEGGDQERQLEVQPDQRRRLQHPPDGLRKALDSTTDRIGQGARQTSGVPGTAVAQGRQHARHEQRMPGSLGVQVRRERALRRIEAGADGVPDQFPHLLGRQPAQ